MYAFHLTVCALLTAVVCANPSTHRAAREGPQDPSQARAQGRRVYDFKDTHELDHQEEKALDKRCATKVPAYSEALRVSLERRGSCTPDGRACVCGTWLYYNVNGERVRESIEREEPRGGRRLAYYDWETIHSYISQPDDSERDVIIHSLEKKAYGRCQKSVWQNITVVDENVSSGTNLLKEDVAVGETDIHKIQTYYRTACSEMLFRFHYLRQYGSKKTFVVALYNKLGYTITAPHDVTINAGCTSGVSSYTSAAAVADSLAVGGTLSGGVVSETVTATTTGTVTYAANTNLCTSTVYNSCSISDDVLLCTMELGTLNSGDSVYYAIVDASFSQDGSTYTNSCPLNSGLNQNQCIPG